MSVSLAGFHSHYTLQNETCRIKKLIRGGWGYFALLLQDERLCSWGFGLDTQDQVYDACFGWDCLFVLYSSNQLLEKFQFHPSDAFQSELISLPGKSRCKGLAAAEDLLLVLQEDGNVWTKSLKDEGDLSLQCVLGPSCERSDVHSKEPFHAIACGSRHYCAVSKSGCVFCWGCNLHYECGNPIKEDILSPQLVNLMGGLCVTSISAGLHHTVVSTDCGDVYSWGSNADGELGRSESSPMPALVDTPVLEDHLVVKVRCGIRHTLALTKEGVVFGWGWNKFNQVGEFQDEKKIVQEATKIKENVLDIECGRWHSMFLLDS